MTDDKSIIADIQTLQNAWATDDEVREIIWAKYKIDVDKRYQDYTNWANNNEEPSSQDNTDNSEWWGYWNTWEDINKDTAGKQYRQAAAALDNAWKLPVVSKYFSKPIKDWIIQKGMDVMKDGKAMEYLMENFADHAVEIFWKSDPELAKKLIEVQKSTAPVAEKVATKWGAKIVDSWTRNVAQALDTETKKKVLWKFLWALVQWIYTDAVMINEVNKENNSWLNKDDWWASTMAALDSATETLPIVSWIDLWLDWLIGWWLPWMEDTTDENWESYSKWWLISKANYLVNNMMWNDSARTFWENSPEEQAKAKEWNDWMEKQWFEWSRFNTWKPSAKKWSKADVMLQNDKAIDKIQWNTKGRWEKATDWESADLEQQHKKDANMYISWKNRSEGKKLDDPDAYTFKDFTKEFYQDKDWSWKKVKWWADAWVLWRNLKKGAEKPEWETINL